MSTDIHPRNPFARGFNDLRIERLLSILYKCPCAAVLSSAPSFPATLE